MESFDLSPGDRVNGRYEVVRLLGQGWEGEVYVLRELATGIERAAKFFYPRRNRHDRVAKAYARKLHALRNCPIIIQYGTHEETFLNGSMVTYLVSEYIEGELLSSFVARQPGRRLHPFVGLHLLHALAKGMADVHAAGEYHGDLHTDNIIVERAGLSFDVKLLDVARVSGGRRENIREDVIQLVNVLYEALGGRTRYASLPPPVKRVLCGLKRGLILERFSTAARLQEFLERLEWD